MMKIKKSTAFFIAFFTFAIMWFCIFIVRPDYLDTVGNLIITIGGSITVGFIGLQVADNTLKGKNYAWQMDENMATQDTKKGMLITSGYQVVENLENLGDSMEEEEIPPPPSPKYSDKKGK